MSTLSGEILCCAHYNARYLPLTENWIYRIIINHINYRPLFLARKKMNAELFPFSELYCLSDLPKWKQYLQILIFKFSGYLSFFREICFKNQVELLHVHFGYQGIKNIGLKRKLNIPMVCSFYGYDAFTFPHIKNNHRKYLRLFEEANRILVLGPVMKNELISLGCPENKITIHHLGIDVRKIRFEMRRLHCGDPVKFLIASSFVPKKGIDVALKALAILKEKYNFSLDIIGDGPLKGEILEIISNGGLQDLVKMHGYKPYDYFIEIAYTCDIFIQASRTGENNNKEGTPMAIVDVMATGMPVIATRHSDIPEMVIDGFNGYLAEEDDLETLVACLEKVFIDLEKIGELSLNGRKWVEKEFDAALQTRKLEELYDKLINVK